NFMNSRIILLIRRHYCAKLEKSGGYGLGLYCRFSHLLRPSSPGNRNRSVTFAWSSLSRISHLSAAGIMILRHIAGCFFNHPHKTSVGPDITEKSANWFTILSSIDGGSKKTTKSFLQSSANSMSDLTDSESIPTVKTFAPSSSSFSLSFLGSSSCALT